MTLINKPDLEETMSEMPCGFISIMGAGKSSPLQYLNMLKYIQINQWRIS